MAVQKRNSELVDLLSPDFVRKNDNVYMAGIFSGILQSLPGIISLWPMSVSLTDDDDVYPNYAYLPGRAGGQVLNGGTASGENLTLRSTAHATKGKILLGTSAYDEVNNRLGVKTASPNRAIQSAGTINVTAGDANFTTSNWVKLMELLASGALQWLKGAATYSRGIGYSTDGNLYFFRSTADDSSAASVNDMYLTEDGFLVIGSGDGTYLIDVVHPTAGSQNIARFGQAGVSNGLEILSDGSDIQVLIDGILGDVPIGLSFGSGWTDFGSGYVGGSYKKVGDMVFLQGLVARTSGVGTTIATLPVGYRPTGSVLKDVLTNSGIDRIDITSGGVVTYISISGGTGWLSLTGVMFSTL